MPEQAHKKFWLSKTFWVNILALTALVVQSQTSFLLTPETQISILAVVNVLLRLITKSEIEWK